MNAFLSFDAIPERMKNIGIDLGCLHNLSSQSLLSTAEHTIPLDLFNTVPAGINVEVPLIFIVWDIRSVQTTVPVSEHVWSGKHSL